MLVNAGNPLKTDVEVKHLAQLTKMQGYYAANPILSRFVVDSKQDEMKWQLSFMQNITTIIFKNNE